MERSNFIHAHSGHEAKKFHIWALTSSIFLLGMVMIMGAVTGYYSFSILQTTWQITKLETKHQKNSDYAQQIKLQQELATLSSELDALERAKELGNNPVPFLHMLAEHINDALHCTTINLSGKQLTLEGQADTTASIMQFIEGLKKQDLIKKVNVRTIRADMRESKPCMRFMLACTTT
jgi:Tfp pilus assembly protein PilN